MPVPPAPGLRASVLPALVALLPCGGVVAQPAVPATVPALDRQALIATLALEPDANVVVAAGDIARCSALEPAMATAALVEAIVDAAGTAVVITTGDHVYQDGTRAELEQCYTPTWGRFESITFPSPGNHDYRTEDGAPFYEYFSHFERDPAARSRGYYSFGFAGWRLVALNSMLSLDDDAGQIAWLEQELRANSSTCLLAYWHHPSFSSGLRRLLPWNPGRRTADAWTTLYGHAAELVINGHEHFYERFVPMNDDGEPAADGMLQITAGTGGGELHTRSLPREHRALRLNIHGVLLLVLSPDSYEYRFVGVDGVVHDASDGPVPCR